MLTASVFVNIPVKSIAKAFTYRVPDQLRFVGVGWRVFVPFGGRKVEGFILAVQEQDAADMDAKLLAKLKDIAGAVDEEAWFTPAMLKAAKWLADFYLCSLAEIMRLFMPGKSGLKIAVAYAAVPEQREHMLLGVAYNRQVYDYLLRQGAHKAEELAKALPDLKEQLPDILAQLLRYGVLRREYVATKREAARFETYLQRLGEVTEEALAGLARKKAQQKLLQYMAVRETAGMPELQAAGFSRELAKKLAASLPALIELRQRRVLRDSYREAPARRPDIKELTQYQQRALTAMEPALAAREYHGFLLQGVTGSGKTQVYIELAKKVRAAGRQVIVLVPEIALTGQVVMAFKAYFPDDIVVMHSQLSQGEKRNNWLRMQNGTSHICIGARSAVFAAAQSIGLFIVDEAHDSSYKQDEAPRYHAVAVARQRAAYYGCPVVLGSATPALADYYRALQGEYVLVELKERVGHRPLPAVQVVDMRDELARGNYRVVSDALLTLLEETLAARQQAIILLNRRGFSTFVMCRKCGYVVKCDTCDVAMVYHRQAAHLRCHYCDAEKPIPTVCPSCGSKYIKFFGSGTEKVEAQLHELLPAARIIRLDQDTTSRKHSGDRIIEAFRRHEYDILLGTQMVAKGHDFPGVSAVGILSADSLLNIPAYWAGERTFQLLTQAAGRAGRGDIPGRVIMQTYAPDHYVIQCAARQDYRAFYDQEVQFRKELGYPPFQEMAKILIQDESEEQVWRKANDVAAALNSWNQDHGDEVAVIGPYEDVIKKIRNKYRVVLSLTGKDLTAIKKAMQHLPACWQTGVIIDIDPM